MAIGRVGRGFTIVELLIVVVVIAVLAAVTAVSYNGITNQARLSAMRSDLASINKAILLYHAANGAYPITPNTADHCIAGWCGYDQATGNDFIPGLAPKYISTIPQMPSSDNRAPAYLYRSDGVRYKLMRYFGTTLPSAESAAMKDLMTTDCVDSINKSRWGYWSDNISRCW